jgi:hypothetical protein
MEESPPGLWIDGARIHLDRAIQEVAAKKLSVAGFAEQIADAYVLQAQEADALELRLTTLQRWAIGVAERCGENAL